MITGDITNQIDRIRDAFWSGGISIGAVERLKAGNRRSLSELGYLFASLQHRAFRGEL
jgi:hypothetical protein